MKIHGYELLYRASADSKSYSSTSSISATAAVLGGLFEQGIDKVVGKAKAFVNFDYDFIMSDTIELIDPETLIIEILETVQVDNVLLERLKYLKKQGYKIALDDFEEDLSTYSAAPLADIIKYDVLLTPLETIYEEVQEALSKNKILLAEKIETNKEFKEAKDMGFQLFQGYFFSRPNIVANKSGAQKSSKIIYTRILNELKKEDFSYDEITNMIVSDVNLSYKLMRILSYRKTSSNFKSIRDALVKMGSKEIERWISVLMLQDVAVGKPTELLRLSLLRSKFSEYIAGRSIFRKQKDEISLMCLFSMLDAILDVTMEEALEGISISDDIVEALVEGKGKFKPICALLSAYEKGEWCDVDKYTKIIHVNAENLKDGYLYAINWTSKILGTYK